MTCKFTINQLHVDFVTNWGRFDVLQSRESVITKRDKGSYKVGQIPLIRWLIMALFLPPWWINGRWIKGRRIKDQFFFSLKIFLWRHYCLLVNLRFIMQNKDLNNPKVLAMRGYSIVGFFCRNYFCDLWKLRVNHASKLTNVSSEFTFLIDHIWISESFFHKWLLASETNSESCQTSMTQLFAKIVKNEKPFTIFVKSSILVPKSFWICFWIGFQS